MTTKEEYARGKKVKVSVTDLTKCYDELLVLRDMVRLSKIFGID